MAICWERAVLLDFTCTVFYFSAVLIVGVPFPFDVYGRMWNLIVWFWSLPFYLLYHTNLCPKHAVNGMANSVDPDQTAPLGAVWSGSALFAQICLSKNCTWQLCQWLKAFLWSHILQPGTFKLNPVTFEHCKSWLWWRKSEVSNLRML